MNDKLTHAPDAWLDDVRRWFYGGSPPEGDARPDAENGQRDAHGGSSPLVPMPPADSATRQARLASEP